MESFEGRLRASWASFSWNYDSDVFLKSVIYLLIFIWCSQLLLLNETDNYSYQFLYIITTKIPNCKEWNFCIILCKQ